MRLDKWWNSYDGKLPNGYLELIAAEAEASNLCYFNPIVVPGLLQTQQYATAITAATMLTPVTSDEIAMYVDVRARRQRVVLDRAREKYSSFSMRRRCADQ